MNDYLDKLEKALGNLNPKVKGEILDDYREHFEIGSEAGKSEAQIIETLGDPFELAKMYAALGATEKAHSSKSAKDTVRMILAIISYKIGGGLLLATLYFAAVSAMLILFATAIGIIAGGIGAVGYAVYMFILSQVPYAVLGIFVSIVFVSGGMLGFIGCKKLWRVSVGNLSGLARRIMRKEAAANDAV